MAPKSTMQKLGDALKALSQMGDDSAPGVTSTATAAPNPSYQDPTKYALQGFPKPPAGTPQEQQIWGLIHAGPNMTSAQKAAAHQALADYWQSKGQADKAARELTRVQYWKAQP